MAWRTEKNVTQTAYLAIPTTLCGDLRVNTYQYSCASIDTEMGSDTNEQLLNTEAGKPQLIF
jgi:hypothetical protein